MITSQYKKAIRQCDHGATNWPLNGQIGNVGTGPPVGVGIGSLPVTPKINGEIGAMCVESGLAGAAQHNKT